MLPGMNAGLRPLLFLLLASFMLPASGCMQGQDGMSAQIPASPEVAQARFNDAIRDGNEALARELMASGAHPNASDGGTPLLHQAMRANDRKAVDLLLALGADPGQGDARGRTAMHEAAMARRGDWIARLLEAGVPVDIPNTLNGQTPLYDALRAREPDNIDRLLEAGARLDVRDRTGTTPLHQAALVNDIPSVRRFLEAGADPGAVDHTGATVASYLYKGDPAMLSAPVRRDYEWVRTRLAGE